MGELLLKSRTKDSKFYQCFSPRLFKEAQSLGGTDPIDFVVATAGREEIMIAQCPRLEFAVGTVQIPFGFQRLGRG